MFKAQIWLKKKDGMSTEEFQRYWLETHAPISRDGYEYLKGYVVNVATGAPKGQSLPYDGVAELTWGSRDDFVADMKSEAAQAGTEDLGNFTDAFGMLFVEQHVVK
jgi:uncharacterized protein (TIGR02118 family)